VVQIHSPRPTFSSRIIVLRWEFCSSCEFFCVLVACRRDNVTADAAGRSEYFHRICPRCSMIAADSG
jgi:hypothetical protein